MAEEESAVSEEIYCAHLAIHMEPTGFDLCLRDHTVRVEIQDICDYCGVSIGPSYYKFYKERYEVKDFEACI